MQPLPAKTTMAGPLLSGQAFAILFHWGLGRGGIAATEPVDQNYVAPCCFICSAVFVWRYRANCTHFPVHQGQPQ